MSNEEWINEVHLVGRVSGIGEQTELPSGQNMVRLRIVVPRTKPTTRTTVDTIDLVCFKAGLGKRLMAVQEDEVIEVTGELRRRFWKAGASVASRMEVEVTTLTRLGPASG